MTILPSIMHFFLLGVALFKQTGHLYTSLAICAISIANRGLTVVTLTPPSFSMYPSDIHPWNNASFLSLSSSKQSGERCFPCAYFPKSSRNLHRNESHITALYAVFSSTRVYLNPALFKVSFNRYRFFFPQHIMVLWLCPWLPLRFEESVHPSANHVPTSFQKSTV